MCGIFGIFGHPEASKLTYLGLHALQHRGQESAGICASNGEDLKSWRGMGRVVDVFNEDTLAKLPGNSAVGHVRYSTAGQSDLVSAQPVVVRHGRGHLALAHNGNLVNAIKLRCEMETAGSIFSTTADSEVIVHLIARAKEARLVDRVKSVLTELKGAYSLLFLSEKSMVVARDKHGFRPLSIGRITGKDDVKDAWVFASETNTFDLIDAEYVRPVAPGEVIVVDEKGMHSYPATEPMPAPRFCVFEHIYFARPDSMLAERSVYASREKLGHQLAKEQPVDADIVIPVPDSGTTAALGFANESGIPFGMGLVRSHYIGRTFIEPNQSIRNFGVRLKLAPVRHLIDGKRVCVVDDSLVRGTTSKKIVQMLLSAGAKEVHLRISAPPTKHPCFYGIDTPSYDELIASKYSLDSTRDYIGCTSLGYISLEGLHKALDSPLVDGKSQRFCDACFSGDYPVKTEDNIPKAQGAFS